MKVAVIADTHLPKGSRALPPACEREILESAGLIHAGDFTTVAVLSQLEALGPPVHAVHGNVDDPRLREALPASTELELGGVRIGIVHDAGAARGRLARLRRQFPGTDAVVFGHSHLPLHEVEGGFQIFNPGSPTERRRAPRRSMGILELDDRTARFRHVWL